MIAGTVEIQMLADMARLRDDVDKGVGLVERGAAKMKEAGTLAGKALGAIGVTLSAAAFGVWIKGAVDSADAVSKLSQRAGVAVADVAGLQLAFELGGSSADGMATGLAKLSKQMVEGNKGFDELGIKTRNTDGTMRGVKDVFYDVADAFAEVEDGAAKSALAQQLFGKSGAELLPLLNGGSAGLREMAEMADKLGLTISEETAKSAEEFNDTLDLLSKSSDGIATRLAAQMLPTLTSLAGAMLEAATDSGVLTSAASILSVGLKGLFTAGVAIVEVFSTVGKLWGAQAAIMAAVARGDFSAAKNIVLEAADDITTGWSKSASTISKAWDDSGNKSVASLTAVAGAQRKLTLQSNDEAAQSKKLADQKAAEVEKQEDDYRKLIDSIRQKTAAIEQETIKGRALSESEKLALDVTAKYTGAKRENALAALATMRAAEEEKNAQDLSTKATEAATAARVKEQETIAAGVLKLGEEIDAQRAANLTTLTGVDNTALLTIAKLRDAAASADRKAMVALERNEDVTLYEQLKLQADKLRELAELKEQGIHVKAAKDAADAWTKTTEQIGQGLTDSLYRAFESGKDFWNTLWDGIKNTVKTTVLKVAIQGVDGKGGIAGSLLGMLGLGSPGAAGAGTGGVGGSLGGLGGLGNFGSMFSYMNDGIGGFLGNGAGQSWLTNFGGNLGNLAGELGGQLAFSSGGSSAIGSWLMSNSGSIGNIAGMAGDALGYLGAIKSLSDGKYGAAAGSAIGTFFGGPIGGTIGNLLGGAVDKLFGGAGTHHSGAGYVSDGIAGRTIRDGSAGLSWSYGASVNKYHNQQVEDALKTITGGSANLLNTLSKSFGGAGGYQVGGYFASDNNRESQGSRSVLLNGRVVSEWGGRGFDKDPNKGLQQLTDALAVQVRDAMVQINVPDWARQQLQALGSGATMEQLAQAVQNIQLTQVALKGLSDVFAPLGGVFGRVAGLGAEATMQLAQFAGGIDALVAKTQSYVTNYYSEGEQAALQAAGIKRALDAAGISAELGNKQDFRTLVDATDVQTEEGRRRLATLLDIQQSFAGVADYLEKSGTTLDALAASAPQIALLQQQVDGQAAQVDAAQQTVEAVNVVNDSIVSVHQALREGFDRLAERMDYMVANATENASYIAGSAAQRYAQA